MRYWTFFFISILCLIANTSSAALIRYDSTFITTIPPADGESAEYYDGTGYLIVDPEQSQLLGVFLDCEPFTYSWSGTASLVEELYWPAEEGRVSALHVVSPQPSLAVSFWFDIFFVPEGESAAAHLDHVVEEDSFYGEYWFRSHYVKSSVNVPEPASGALLLFALAGAYLTGRRM